LKRRAKFIPPLRVERTGSGDYMNLHLYRRLTFLALILVSLLFLLPVPCSAQVKRVVIVKVDDLPYDLLDRFVSERDPRTGKSQLPWIERF
jgi:hypothetical protein